MSVKATPERNAYQELHLEAEAEKWVCKSDFTQCYSIQRIFGVDITTTGFRRLINHSIQL